MRVLLDTNVVLDLALGSDVLRRDVVEQLSDDATVLVVSTVAPWEISIKWRQGRLPIPEHPSIWAPRMIREFGAEQQPVRPPPHRSSPGGGDADRHGGPRLRRI